MPSNAIILASILYIIGFLMIAWSFIEKDSKEAGRLTINRKTMRRLILIAYIGIGTIGASLVTGEWTNRFIIATWIYGFISLGADLAEIDKKRESKQMKHDENERIERLLDRDNEVEIHENGNYEVDSYHTRGNK